jgi:3-oxoacyl-[acyl-carrier-protein] synthase-3
MNFRNVVMESIQMALPQEIWTSEAIERRMRAVYDRLRVSVGRLELMTGIRERRVWAEDFLPSVEASSVAARLLQNSRITRDQIGLLIHSGVCRDRLEPATAAYVHRNLGLGGRTQFLDVSNACLGFLNAALMASAMIESCLIPAALIVTAESSRDLINNTVAAIHDPGLSRHKAKHLFANLTIGSGAVAALLCHRDLAPDAPRLVGGVVRSDSSHNALCQGGEGRSGHEMLTDSEALLKAGIALSRDTWSAFQAELQWDEASVDHYICHQVGKMHQQALYEGLGLNPEKDFSTYPTLGNMGSAALPGTLAAAAETGRLCKGNRVALLGIGSGISSIMMGLQW